MRPVAAKPRLKGKPEFHMVLSMRHIYRFVKNIGPKETEGMTYLIPPLEFQRLMRNAQQVKPRTGWTASELQNYRFPPEPYELGQTRKHIAQMCALLDESRCSSECLLAASHYVECDCRCQGEWHGQIRGIAGEPF